MYILYSLTLNCNFHMHFNEFNEKCCTELDCVNLFIKIYYNNNLHCTLCKEDKKISIRKIPLRTFNAITVIIVSEYLKELFLLNHM